MNPIQRRWLPRHVARTSRTLGSLLLSGLVCLLSPEHSFAQDKEAAGRHRTASRASVTMLPQAHAHNDYQHDRPLLDALDRGFCGVEADVFAVRGELLVGHSVLELRKGRTLTALYLEPLAQWVEQHRDQLYPHGPTLTLLIDFKRDGEHTYAVLKQKLTKYRGMLCHMENGKYVRNPVQIVISGDRPQQTIAEDTQRMVAIDGRLGDLDSRQPAHLLPLISDRWTSHFRWRGDGDMPEEEKAKLTKIVQKAHQSGRRVRFWATPEKEALWIALREAQVDHINTDQLDKLQQFLRRATP